MSTAEVQPDGLTLMRLHVRALYTHDGLGRLHHVREEGGAIAPRFFLGRTLAGHACAFRHDVSDDTIAELTALAAASPPSIDAVSDDEVRRYTEVLARASPVEQMESGPAYWFLHRPPVDPQVVRVTADNVEVLRLHMGAWLGDVDRCQPFAAVVEHGSAVAVCASVRITSEAHEAGVETARSFRGRGLAALAAATWAEAVRDSGALPMYSTSWENTSSQRVASKLGLVQFGSDLHIA